MGFGVFVFAGLICFTECSKPDRLNFEESQRQDAINGRGEYFIDRDGVERFRYFRDWQSVPYANQPDSQQD